MHSKNKNTHTPHTTNTKINHKTTRTSMLILVRPSLCLCAKSKIPRSRCVFRSAVEFENDTKKIRLQQIRKMTFHTHTHTQIYIPNACSRQLKSSLGAIRDVDFRLMICKEEPMRQEQKATKREMMLFQTHHYPQRGPRTRRRNIHIAYTRLQEQLHTHPMLL